MSVSMKSDKELSSPRIVNSRPAKTLEYLPSSVREQLAVEVESTLGPTHTKLSEILWRKNEDKAQEALQTDFIQGIQSGSLHPTDYGKYTVQDAVYCHQATEYCKIATIKAQKANDTIMTEFLKAHVGCYKQYTNSMFKDWHICDPNAIKLGEAARSYTDFGRTVAETKGPFYLLIAMLPCEMLWKWLAKQIKSGIKETNVYSFWIEENLCEDTDYLAKFIDTHFEMYSCDQREAEDIYRCAMEGEVNFFSSATRVSKETE